MNATALRVGTAGWGLPKNSVSAFVTAGSGLEKYASRFSVVEINSSFYRTHKRLTYERWSAATPAEFRFSVKMTKEVTHKLRLKGVMPALHTFFDSAEVLGAKLGCLVVQLPPSLKFESDTFIRFANASRTRYEGAVALEPRHRIWFESEANRLLAASRISRVLADPVSKDLASAPGAGLISST